MPPTKRRPPRPAPPSSFRPPSSSIFGPPPPSSLPTLLKSSPILTLLVARLDWPDLLSLLNTCRDCRSLFCTRDFRDIVLARFVPGYTDALGFRELANYHDVPVSLYDLDLFLISQRLPLHRYPMHALRILTALYPTLEDNYITTKLTALSRAHSRFVLLLQALVHSSTASLPLEPRDFPRRSRRLPSPHAPSHQLTFPAPLSYLRDQQQQQQQQPHKSHHSPAALPALSKRSKHHSLPAKLKSIDDPLLPHPFRITHDTRPSRPSADSISSMISINNNIDPFGDSPKHVRRRSLFKHTSVTPPPPEEPRALRFYSSAWRRGSSHQPNLDYSYVSELGQLEKPHRRFASINVSSDSSISGSPITSTSPFLRTGRSSNSSSTPSTPPLMSTSLPLPIRMTSPHDLSLSTSRVRAPVLRVFVPCTKMEVDSESVLLCENHLIEAGLWEHLSVGDIVCNLGYIPPAPDDGSLDTEDDGGWDSSPFRPGYRSSTTGGGNGSRKWLLFNGQYLEPYSPPGLLPIGNPTSLPSPFYFAHIMPASSISGFNGNFRFLIERFPPVTDEIPQLALVNVAGRVRSAKSVNGWLEVRKWAWTARVVRQRQLLREVLLPEEEIGDGWLGEWVLEGEGTSEGRQMLLDALAGYVLPLGAREWELVRDRSGEGRIWLRSLTC